MAIKKYEYKDFVFRIWDLFSNFTLDDNNLTIKVILFDPLYYMPGEKNYNVKINFSPSNGKIDVNPKNSVESLLTIFTIECYDYVGNLFFLYII